MRRAFSEAPNIPEADINLGPGSRSHTQQMVHTMIAFEKVLNERVKVAHIEAGLRSTDLKMPEEINRFVGNIMIDTLEAQRGKPWLLDIGEVILRDQLLHDLTVKMPGSIALQLRHVIVRPMWTQRKRLNPAFVFFAMKLPQMCHYFGPCICGRLSNLNSLLSRGERWFPRKIWKVRRWTPLCGH